MPQTDLLLHHTCQGGEDDPSADPESYPLHCLPLATMLAGIQRRQGGLAVSKVQCLTLLRVCLLRHSAPQAGQGAGKASEEKDVSLAPQDIDDAVLAMAQARLEAAAELAASAGSPAVQQVHIPSKICHLLCPTRLWHSICPLE